MQVDARIQELENLIATHLQYALLVNINLNFWEELDELDNDSVQVIRDIVHDVFEPMRLVYTGTTVEEIIIDCKTIIEHALVASMNVPFPRDPIMHIHHVVRNMTDIFINRTYANLRTEMVMVNHHARVLQRAWREAVSNPTRAACRRRLMREFNELETGGVH